MRKLMWFTVGAAAASGLSVYLLSLDMLGILAAVCAVLFTAMLILSIVCRRAKPAAAALLGAALLLNWNYGFRTLYLSPITQLDGQTVELTVTLTDYSQQTQYGIVVEGFTEIQGKTYRIRAYANDDTLSLKPGDSLIGSFRLKDATAKTGVAPQHKGNGIFVIGYPKGEIYHRVASELPWYGYPAYLAATVKGLIHAAFPADTLGFAQARSLGIPASLTTKRILHSSSAASAT